MRVPMGKGAGETELRPPLGTPGFPRAYDGAMDLQLRNKGALVTGSTAGIGLAIATALASEGASVFVNGRTQARVDEATAAIRKRMSNADVSGVAGDLSTRGGCDALVARLPDVDILVNNMGIFQAKPFAEIPDEDWLR